MNQISSAKLWSAQRSLDFWFGQIGLTQISLDQLYFIWFLFGFGSGLVSKSSLWCLCSAQKCFRTGSLLGAGYLVLNSRIWIGLLVFDTPLFNFGSLSWFWRCKEHQCPLSPDFRLLRTLGVPDWGLASSSYLDRITSICYTRILKVGSLSWFWGCKEHPCPLSPNLWLWRMLEVPD